MYQYQLRAGFLKRTYNSPKAGITSRREASCCSEVNLPARDFSFCSLRNCWRKLPSLTNLLETQASPSVPSSLNRKRKAGDGTQHPPPPPHTQIPGCATNTTRDCSSPPKRTSRFPKAQKLFSSSTTRTLHLAPFC